MKRIENLTTNLFNENEKKSPFAIYEGEMLKRYKVDRPTGVTITELDEEIVKLLSSHLVLTSELLFRLFNNRGLNYQKNDIQLRLKKLAHSLYVQKISFEDENGGACSSKAYILASRGIYLLNSLGIRYKLGGWLAERDIADIKRLLAVNQLIIAGKYDNIKVANIAFVEPTNEKEKASVIVRPAGIVFNENEEAICFIDGVRRNPEANDILVDKLERMTQLYNKSRKVKTNIKISDKLSVIIVAEDYCHMCEIIELFTKKRFMNRLTLYFTHDNATNISEDFLYEYTPKKERGFLAGLVACL